MPATPEVTALFASVESERLSDQSLVHNVIVVSESGKVRLECFSLHEATDLARMLNESVSALMVLS